MTMTAATKDSLDLCDAILGNSASLVEYCLHAEGKDPNYNPTLNLYEDVPKDDDDKVDASEKLLGEDADYVCSPLHVAILNCYHNGRMDGIAHKQRIAALKILDLLLEAGADTSTTCNKVLFCNVGDLNISSPGAPLDPIALTLSLKKVRQSSVHADEKVDMMDQVMERLINARKREKRKPSPTKAIPTLIADNYKNLCCSTEYSDVTIQSSDGAEIPAHCAVLNTCSPSLAKALSPNKENQILKWNRSEKVVRAILSFLYTGSMDNDVLHHETASLLSFSAENQIEALEQLCAAKCGERLTIHNVRMMLEIGERHKAKWITKECLDFLQSQPIPVVLGHPKLLALHKDNPKLFEQLMVAIGGQYQKGHEEEQPPEANKARTQST